MLENFPWLIFCAISMGTLLVFLAFAGIDPRVRRRVDNLRQQDNSGRYGRAASGPRSRGPVDFLMQSPVVPKIRAHLLPNDEQTRIELQTRLLHAGIYSPKALLTYCSVKLFLMVLPPLVSLVGGWCEFWEMDRGLFWGALAGCAAVFVPGRWLDYRKSRHQRVLRRSLPDFLDLLSTCVSAGLSIQMAIKRVTEELSVAHPTLAAEMNAVQRELELGATLADALRHLGDRTDLDDLRSLALFVQQSQRFGASMSDAMEELADGLRYQREQRAEELAQKASVKILIPTLLFIFPAVLIVLAGPAVIQLQQEFVAPNAETRASKAHSR